MDVEALKGLFGLAGKVALVTGATGGIGNAIAQGLAKAGARVALNGRSEEKLQVLCQTIGDAGGEAMPFPADVADVAAVEPLVDRVVRQLGRLDILVNCAGINRRMPIADVTPAIYDEIMSTNLKAIYFLSQRAAPHMARAGGGKIINVGSVTAQVGLNDVSVYGMTKSALVLLTKTMAIEWAPQNIQVNCLCPGFIATELTIPLWESVRSDWILARVPAKRAGTPHDLVGMAIYLAAPCSDFTTGQAIYVDGGFTAGNAW